MKIKSVRHIGKAKTLDLEVNHPLHQFYCNGLLTSNSHSVSYTYISFREYWLKAYYPAEFCVALLNNTVLKKEKSGENLISQYVIETLKKGIIVHSPNVNASSYHFKLISDPICLEHEIVWGLNWIKGIAEKSIQHIIEERENNGEYQDINDFYSRLQNKEIRALNKRVLEALIFSGALDLFINNAKLPKHVQPKLLNDRVIGDRFELHKYLFEELRKEKKYDEENYTLKKVVDREVEYISISLTELTLYAKIRKKIEKQTGEKMNFLYETNDIGEYCILAKIESVTNHKTKTKKDYKKVTLRDETKILKNVFVWPWNCKNSESLKAGKFIECRINHEESGFINMPNFDYIS